jgi:hypothetical protein
VALRRARHERLAASQRRLRERNHTDSRPECLIEPPDFSFIPLLLMRTSILKVCRSHLIAKNCRRGGGWPGTTANRFPGRVASR